MEQQNNNAQQNTISIIPLGGPGEVTRNMYVYEYKDEILVVDCGIGFADETMLGVDLQLPDITYLLQTGKKLVGLLLTHGHEDHIGALPFHLPELQKKHGKFPVYASRLTAALVNEKLKEFHLEPSVQTVAIDEDNEARLGDYFRASFFRVTHSVPDSSHIFIQTPVGNFYHGSDFKFDLTPYDGKKSDHVRIANAGEKGILCLLSDCLGSEHQGFSLTEDMLSEHIDQAMGMCKGKFFVTTYSSHVARLNQIIAAAIKHKRKICFVGRSLMKIKELGKKLELLTIPENMEVEIDQLYNLADHEVVLVVAGSQGQENSALTRIADGEHKDIKITPDDMVVFSSDPIPGNEISVYELIDTISKIGAKVLTSDTFHKKLHVSGHGTSKDLLLLMSLTKAKFVMPISGNYRHMIAYRDLAQEMGYRKDHVCMIENGQEIIFSQDTVRYGRRIPTKKIYVDQVSGEEVASFVLRDRERLAHDGIVVVMAEINAQDGQLVDNFGVITRGFAPAEAAKLEKSLAQQIRKKLSNKKDRVTNWVHLRKTIEAIASKYINLKLRRQPLVVGIIIEV